MQYCSIREQCACCNTLPNPVATLSLFTYTHKRTQILRPWQKRHYDSIFLFYFFLLIFYFNEGVIRRSGIGLLNSSHIYTHTGAHTCACANTTQDRKCYYMKKPVSYEKRKKNNKWEETIIMWKKNGEETIEKQLVPFRWSIRFVYTHKTIICSYNAAVAASALASGRNLKNL